MEDEHSLDTQSSSTNTGSIYKNGGAFYKLTKKQYSPSMNILKTFDLDQPHCMDIRRNTATDDWPQRCIDVFVLILEDVEIFSRENGLTTCQMAAVYEIFYSCFQFLMLLPALGKDLFLQYFRDTLVLYCVQDPPEALRIFNGIQAFNIAKLFHKLIENNFEMIKFVLVTEYVVEYETVRDL